MKEALSNSLSMAINFSSKPKMNLSNKINDLNKTVVCEVIFENKNNNLAINDP